MEFIQSIFGSKRKRQETLIQELGIAGGQYHEKGFVGPDYEQGDTVDVQPEKFLKIVEERNIKQVNTESGRGSDTHIPYDVFAQVDKKLNLHIKVTASTPLWHAPQNPDQYQTLLPKLEQMGFKKDPGLSKEKWSVYKKD